MAASGRRGAREGKQKTHSRDYGDDWFAFASSHISWSETLYAHSPAPRVFSHKCSSLGSAVSRCRSSSQVAASTSFTRLYVNLYLLGSGKVYHAITTKISKFPHSLAFPRDFNTSTSSIMRDLSRDPPDTNLVSRKS